MSGRPAAFLDRDGTIIRDASYIRDPRDVELLPGAADAIRALNEAAVAVVVITNQSGIARGFLTLGDYAAVQARLEALLAERGARLTATYMCPHHPDVTGECDCRKPGLGMYRAAIGDLEIDPARSVFIGDRWRDVAPALALGGLPIMLDAPSTHDDDRIRARDESIHVAASLSDAVELFLRALPASPRAP